ncbi:MAG: DUF1385 domain-containing protein [Polyangiaceae bacterium]
MSNQPPVLGPDGVARPYIGGQALIEGVMMRSPRSYAAVVRRRTGALVVREEEMLDPRTGFRGYPLVRGVITLVEALKLGSRCLRFSAELYEQDLDAEEKEKQGKDAAKSTGPSTLALLSLPIIALATQTGDEPASGTEERGKKFFTFLSILFALLLFVALPQAFAEGTSRVFGLGLDVRSVGFQVLTGIAKLTIVVGYMLVIRRLPEIYRVFQYHGAEHKAIYTYESGEELTLANARAKTTLHPRCGTTFLVMVALVSIVVFSAAGPLLPQLGLGKLADNVAFFLIKLPFLPLIAAITFEMQRFLAKRSDGPLRFLLAPGFLVQKITTIEPEDGQLEVALAALRATLRRESGETPLAADGEATFDGFEALASHTPASA